MCGNVRECAEMCIANANVQNKPICEGIPSIAYHDRFTYNAPFAIRGGWSALGIHHGTERRRRVDVGGLLLNGPRATKD